MPRLKKYKEELTTHYLQSLDISYDTDHLKRTPLTFIGRLKRIFISGLTPKRH